MAQELKHQLTNIVKESAIADIIMSDKKDLEQARRKNLYKQWRKEVSRLEKELSNAKANVYHLKKDIKNNCKHTDVIEEISDGWDRCSHDYHCKQCGFYVQIHDEFDYRNITETINC